MSVRAVLLGLLLGLAICLTTYFNDFVMNGAALVNHLLPISVLGFILLLTLVANPVLRLLGQKAPFRPAELVVITALGLVACAWPDASFFRTAVTNLSMPTRQYKVKTKWQQQKVFAYVPGGSVELTPGYLPDPPALARQLLAHATDGPDKPLGYLCRKMTAEEKSLLAQAVNKPAFPIAALKPLLSALNRTLSDPQFLRLAQPTTDDTPKLEKWQIARENRRLLGELLPGLLLPPPAGEGLILAGGRDDPAVEALTRPPAKDIRFSLDIIPWSAWWPTIRLWGGLALLLAVAVVGLGLVLHNQWSRHELLPYPIARFVSELTEREPTGWLPQIARNRLFWYGLIIVFLIHLTNGLNLWFDWPFSVPQRINLTPLKVLFPTASRSPSNEAVFWPIIFFSAIAFAYFLQSAVSFSLGVAPLLYIVFTSFLIDQGIPMNYDYIGGERPNLLRFGAYLGMGLMILYVGRHYYARTLTAAVGYNPQQRVARAQVWAMRAFLLASFAAIAWLTSAGIGWMMASLGIACVLLIFLVLARITAETGLFFIQPQWLPVGVLTALLGFEAIGPSAYLVLALVSTMLVGDPRTLLLPFLVNGLKMTENATDNRPGRLAPWLLVMIVAGFLVAGVATLWVAYNYGVMRTDPFTREMLPGYPFERLADLTSKSLANGQLAASVGASELGRLALFDPARGAYFWMGLGLALVLVTLFARLRFPWWPLHPVLFLVWGTWAMDRYAFSFLLGCGIKWAIVKFGGTKAYHRGVPVMVGIIAGELAASLLWLAAGVAYYLAHGTSPPVKFTVF